MNTSRLSAWAAAGLLLTSLTFSACNQKRDMDSGNGPDSSSTTDLPTDNSTTTSTDTASTMPADTAATMSR